MEQDRVSETCPLTRQGSGPHPGAGSGVCHDGQPNPAGRDGEDLCLYKRWCPYHLEQGCWSWSGPRSLWTVKRQPAQGPVHCLMAWVSGPYGQHPHPYLPVAISWFQTELLQQEEKLC